MTFPAWHRTKIVCTLGPATDAPGVMERLIRAGMDVARINLSHGTAADSARRIGHAREVAQQLGQTVAILADLPGPKFRLGVLAQGVRTLHGGTAITLAATQDDAAFLPVRNRGLLSVLKAGEVVYLADGSVELRVTSGGQERVVCEVVIGGTVRSGSGINVPEANFGGHVPTPEDRVHLAFALSHAVEWIGVSFVQDAEDLARVRACFPASARALLMAKIEKRRALAQLDGIIEAADGVMVARGDLGVETDLAEIPLVQKRIIAAANERGRPVVTATQMLESMIEREHPTRAEVTDVANAVLDGTDAVMLSGETAIGRNPVAAVEIMNRVLSATEGEHSGRMAAECLQASAPDAGDAVSFVACQLALRLGAKAIIAAVPEFGAVAAIARFRPAVPLLVATDSDALSGGLAALRGAVPLSTASGADAARALDAARNWLFARGLASPGEAAVLLLASSLGAAKADTLQVVRL